MDSPKDLDAFRNAVWQRLSRGVADRRAAARNPVLSTVGLDGAAKARVVVLRGADPSGGRLEMHTDAESQKVAELTREPGATALVWDARAKLQIRAEGALQARSGTEQEWDRVPAAARRVYGGTPHPGKAIAAPAAFAPSEVPARFCVLTLEIARLDVLWLGPELHYRAFFERGDGWAGQWVAP